MPAGRPRKPIERQAADARGDGRRPSGRKPDTALVPANPRGISIPSAPSELGHKGEIEWYKIWEAGQVWLHPNEDYHWILQIAQAYDDIEVFRQEIARTGLIVKGYTKDMLVANPLIKEVRLLEATIRKCLSQIGFSPVDRARLGLAEIKRQSGLQNLQQKTRQNRGKQ